MTGIDELAEMERRGAQPPERQASDWIQLADDFLKIHRNQFLSQEPAVSGNSDNLLHKTTLELLIQTGYYWVNAEVAHREKITCRLQLLKDAFTVFHDPRFSEAEAHKVLRDIFPE